MENLNALVAQLLDFEVPAAGIRATLKKKGFSKDEIEAAVPVTKKLGFASEFYDWLAEAERSEEESNDFILLPREGKKDKNGKTNIERHLSHYQNIADLARKIWNV